MFEKNQPPIVSTIVSKIYRWPNILVPLSVKNVFKKGLFLTDIVIPAIIIFSSCTCVQSFLMKHCLKLITNLLEILYFSLFSKIFILKKYCISITSINKKINIKIKVLILPKQIQPIKTDMKKKNILKIYRQKLFFKNCKRKMSVFLKFSKTGNRISFIITAEL